MKSAELRLPFQSTVGCGGMVSLFEQLNLIGNVKIMTRILRYRISLYLTLALENYGFKIDMEEAYM